MKWAFFIRELVHPVRVPPGGIRELDDETFHALRATPDALLDLTPKPIKNAFDVMLGNSPFMRAASTARIIPCPACMSFVNNQWISTKQYTHCNECGGAYSVAVQFAFSNENVTRFLAKLREDARKWIRK